MHPRVLLGFVLVCLPAAAFAQRIPVPIAIAAVSPVFVLLLIGLLGFLRRSWRFAGKHAGLIVLWIVLLGIFTKYVANDYIIWTPLALYTLHSLLVAGLLIVETAKRVAGRRR